MEFFKKKLQHLSASDESGQCRGEEVMKLLDMDMGGRALSTHCVL